MSKLNNLRMEIPLRDICAYKHIRKPYLNYAIISILIFVFIYQILFLKDNAVMYMLNWNLIVGGEYWRLVTYIFLHADWWVWFIPIHLLSNIYFLYLFGDNCEDWFSRNKYIRFIYVGMFILWGIIAGVAFGISEPTLFCLGASGAISGCLGFYFIMYPYAQIDILSLKAIPVSKWEDLQTIWKSKIIYPVSAYYFLWGWFTTQFIVWWYVSDESIAYLAHIAGFLAGVVTAVVCKIIIKEPITSEFLVKLKESIMCLIGRIKRG